MKEFLNPRATIPWQDDTDNKCLCLVKLFLLLLTSAVVYVGQSAVSGIRVISCTRACPDGQCVRHARIGSQIFKMRWRKNKICWSGYLAVPGVRVALRVRVHGRFPSDVGLPFCPDVLTRRCPRCASSRLWNTLLLRLRYLCRLFRTSRLPTVCATPMPLSSTSLFRPALWLTLLPLCRLCCAFRRAHYGMDAVPALWW